MNTLLDFTLRVHKTKILYPNNLSKFREYNFSNEKKKKNIFDLLFGCRILAIKARRTILSPWKNIEETRSSIYVREPRLE